MIEAGTKTFEPPRSFTSLHLHTKKLGQIGLTSKAEILTENDELSVDFGELVPNPEFSLKEFDDIPGKHLDSPNVSEFGSLICNSYTNVYCETHV